MSTKTETPNPIMLSSLKMKIETETEKKVELCVQSKSHDFGKSLVQIMQEGANDFKKQTGRNMTYSEMREMYG
jgi:methanogenic corrinoid protein MtbC1